MHDHRPEESSLGIDIGGTAVKAALLRPHAAPVTARSRAYEGPTIVEVAEAIRLAAAEVLVRVGLDHPESVGVSVAGPIDDRGVLLAAANLRDLIDTRIGVWVAEVLDVETRVAVVTDAVAAAMAEHMREPHPGRVLYLSIGTGVGGAVLDGGEPLLITRGTAGHIGHIDVSGGEPNPPRRDGCGRGALEAYIGYRALQEAGVPADEPAWFEHDAAEPALSALVRGMRTMLAIYRPDEIVLMGGVGETLGPTLRRLRERVVDDLTPAAPQRWTLRCGKSGQFAAAVGAARAGMTP
jgi:glucokinase